MMQGTLVLGGFVNLAPRLCHIVVAQTTTHTHTHKHTHTHTHTHTSSSLMFSDARFLGF
ncbi:hypothetical protein N9L68_05010 [bacterium]|nr:hypothetical protein [bacterium]